MMSAAGLSVLVVVAVVGLLMLASPGRPAAVVDDAGEPIPGSLSKRVFVEINGVRQGMIIQSADPKNPVLLFLHGGPGMPEFFLNSTHPSGLERDFTVVWWEQRGAGMSYSADIPPGSMTVDQMLADGVAVATYLRDRFQQEKIILLGHSWGSFLGLQLAARAPELFHAYVGMAQVSHQLRSEVLAREHLITQYRAAGDSAMVRRLEAAPVDMTIGLSEDYMRLRDGAMHRLGVGTTRDMRSVVTGVFLPVWRSSAYTIREKVNIWKGLAWSRRFLWDDFLRTDLSESVHRLEVPMIFLVGRHDYTANHDLAKALFAKIDAPRKSFHTFEHSAHSPIFEEPEHARRIFREHVIPQE